MARRWNWFHTCGLTSLPLLGGIVLNLQGSDMIKHGFNGIGLITWAFVLYSLVAIMIISAIIIPRRNKLKVAMQVAKSPKLVCPNCENSKYTWEEDRMKPVGRNTMDGSIVYEIVYTCKVCGKRFKQEESLGL